MQPPKKRHVKLLKSGSNQLGTIYGGAVRPVKAMKNYCVKNGLVSFSMYKTSTVGQAIRNSKNVNIHGSRENSKKAKEWIKPNTEAFTVLQSIILDPKLLADLQYLTKFSHTGVLEVYHSLYNKWAPKRQHFFYAGMLARSQLAVMDFNEGSNLKQAKTKD